MISAMETSKRQDPTLTDTLRRWADKVGAPLESRKFAVQMDLVDPMKECRENFHYPKMKQFPLVDLNQVDDPDEECVYMAGNSLGLKPKKTDAYQQDILADWENMGLYMFINGRHRNFQMEGMAKESLAKLVGAHPDEVACMNGLSVNMHLLLLSFYRPTATRYKILIEERAFSSDRYGVVSQLSMHGYSEEDALIIVRCRPGEHTVHQEDILTAIKEHGKSVAVIFLPGVSFYTGQKFDIEAIVRAGHEEGCFVGWDLAHAIGNVELKLHEWKADFACWCSLKYLNSGPGAIGGVFVHRTQFDRPKLAGWFSNRIETRMQLHHSLDVAPGADAYRLCNPPTNMLAMHKAALEIFDQVDMKSFLEKQYLLTGYLEYLIDTLPPSSGVRITTPRDPKERGSQLSITASVPLNEVDLALRKKGMACSVFSPSGQPVMMRFAPVPVYNSFLDVYRFFTVFQQVLSQFQSPEN